MNELLRLRLLANAGVVHTAELAAAGYDRHATRALVKGGELVRVRAGSFVGGDAFRAGNAAARHVLTCRSIARRLRGYAVTDLSAVACWDLPVVAADIGHVHLAQVGSGRARRSGVVRVHPPVKTSEVLPHRGVLVVIPEVAVLQASERSMRAGLIAADACVRMRLTTPDRLVALAESHHFGFAAHRVAGLASGLSESPGESWTRLVLDGLGVEAEQQVVIRDHDGRFVARVDFLLPALRVVVEFDGAVKYEGADGRNALIREKRREDALRALGYRVVRLTWSDLRRPERVLAALGLGARTSA